MSLKKRLILILVGSGLVLGVLFHFSVNTTLVPDLKRQKEHYIEKLKTTLQTSLAEQEKSISALCTSWADWDGMKDYIEKPSPEFEQEFFSDSSFLGHGMNMILIMGPGENILFNKNYRTDVKFVTLDQLAMETDIDYVTAAVKEMDRPFYGIVNTAYGPLMTAAEPVNGKNGKGMVILGRFIDQVLLEKISHHFVESLQPVSFKNKTLFGFYLGQMQGNDFHSWEDKKKITILHLVKDLQGVPSIIFKIEADNNLSRAIRSHTRLYIFFSVLSMLLLGTLLYFLIGKYINKRIVNISDEMKNVGGLQDISRRITLDTVGDEISSLINDINTMLDKIESEKETKQDVEQMLITSEKLVCIGRLTSSIAHEINNPMLVISNCLQALKNTCANIPDMNKEALEVSRKEIDRVRNIIANLLDFHRPDTEAFSEVNLNDVLLQSLDVLKWSNKLDSIKILTPKKRSFLVFGSQSKLKQVFFNFILNAAEAGAGKKGILRIEILPSEDEKYCEVHFIDNGPGLSQEIKERLFEPFVSTKQDKGVGLGLYVSYKIIKNHNGEIVYNDTYKEGTYFIVKLPVMQKERQP